MDIVLDNKSQINITYSKKKKKIKGYYKNRNRIDLDSYMSHPGIDIKYCNVIFPMYISGLDMEQDSYRKIKVKYRSSKLVYNILKM